MPRLVAAGEGGACGDLGVNRCTQRAHSALGTQHGQENLTILIMSRQWLWITSRPRLATILTLSLLITSATAVDACVATTGATRSMSSATEAPRGTSTEQ